MNTNRTEEEFNEVTAEISKAIALALAAYAKSKGVEYNGPAPRDDDDIALACDASPTVRALVSLAAHIVSALPAEMKVSLADVSVKTMASAGGYEFMLHMRNQAMAARGGDEHGIGGFTRPLSKTTYH